MSPVTARAARAGVVALLAAVLLLAGCTQEEAPVEHPEGSVRLVANQPKPVDGLTVVAGNIEDGSAMLNVGDGTGPADVAGLDVGASAVLKGRTFTLLETVVDAESDEDSGDGASTSAVWVLVE